MYRIILFVLGNSMGSTRNGHIKWGSGIRIQLNLIEVYMHISMLKST